MKISTQRLEAFSDGVIAIIITIMVLSIPLTDEFTFDAVMGLMKSILILFVSFFVVGSEWNKHRFLFDQLSEVSNKIVWRNILYLFFLSLMPLFTKWVIQNPGEVVPAIAYDLVFLFVNMSYQFMFDCVAKENSDAEFFKRIEKMRAKRRYSWIGFVITIVIIGGIFIFSFFYPLISIICFMGVPVVSSIFNLIADKEMGGRKRKPMAGKIFRKDKPSID